MADKKSEAIAKKKAAETAKRHATFRKFGYGPEGQDIPLSDKNWFDQHPSVGQWVPESVQEGILGLFSGAEAAPGQARWFGDPNAPAPNTTIVPKTGTTTPKTGKQSRASDKREALRFALGDVSDIHKQFAIDDVDAETVMGGYLDSEGADGTREGYTKYAQKWAGVGDGERRLKTNDLVIVDADKDAGALGKAFAANKPVVIRNASKYGFDSDEVIVVGDGSTKKQPEEIVKARRPVITKPDFMGVIRRMMQGG